MENNNQRCISDQINLQIGGELFRMFNEQIVN
jgi:hypothetical protein